MQEQKIKPGSIDHDDAYGVSMTPAPYTPTKEHVK
jgi:hypothetical protein